MARIRRKFEDRQRNEAVSTVAIMLQLKCFTSQRNIIEFKCSFSSIFIFMKRNKISIRSLLNNNYRKIGKNYLKIFIYEIRNIIDMMFENEDYDKNTDM